MNKIRRSGVVSVGLLALMLAGAAPATAGETPPGEMARQALEKLMRSLELFVDTIPQYEMPEVLPNGDILIRRKPSAEPPPKPRPKPDHPKDGGTIEETRT